MRGGIAMSVTDELLKNNEAYARSFDKGTLPLPPAKKLAVLACMDARLHVSKILGLNEGDAHVIRNAGGVATDDAIRSLTISQRLLGTEEIVLIHHTDCGMLTFSDDQVKAQIAEDVGIRPHFALEAFSDLQADVRQTIARIKASPFIPKKDKIRGGVPLATVMRAAGTHLPLAISLHDPGLLDTLAGFNRWLTGRVGLVISPTHDLLDQHLDRGFFRRAIQQILPYGIEPAPPPRRRPVKDTFDVFFLDPAMSGEARRARLEYTECVILPFLRPDRFLVTIQEAFQLGAVVIAARAGAITEMVRDGVNGILVEPGDHAAIDAAIRRLQDSPELAARLRAAAVETVRLYDMRFHIDRLSDAYQQLVIASRTGDLDRPAA